MTAGERLSLKHWALLIVVSLALFLPGFATLPPTDRDESRYVVTSERMADTGDIVDLRFQDQPRYLQPAGIYWLQALSTAVLDSPAHDSIWTYRIPSLLGALLAVLLTGWIGTHVFGRNAGLAAAAMLAMCFSLNFEARIAKIDAALLAAVTATQLALMRAYLEPTSGRWNAALFWFGLGAGLMLKGPVVLITAATTSAALAAWDRKAAWLMRLRPAWGPLVTVAVAAPWLIAIGILTDGAFYRRSVLRNFLGKVGAGEQGHKGPPGYHLALFVFAFWPASLLAFRAVGYAWRERAQPVVRFLLCWIVPTWIVFEFVATKLPHYVLPTYPAIACLAAVALFDPRAARPSWTFGIVSVLWLAASAIVAFGAPYGLRRMQGVTDPLAVALAVLAFVAALVALWLVWRGRVTPAVGALTLAALLAWSNGFAVVAPQLRGVWMSEEINSTVRAARSCDSADLVTIPYSEPSLIFLYGRTKTQLAVSGADAADRLVHAPRCSLALIGSAQESDFLARAAAIGVRPRVVSQISGTNYSNGDRLDLTLYSSETAPGSSSVVN